MADIKETVQAVLDAHEVDNYYGTDAAQCSCGSWFGEESGVRDHIAQLVTDAVEELGTEEWGFKVVREGLVDTGKVRGPVTEDDARQITEHNPVFAPVKRHVIVTGWELA